MERHIQLPLTEELAKTLHAGDSVYLTGTIYTSRDAGHKRMCEALARGEKLPFDPTDATIYYVGPTPAKPGQVIGSAGPTTSGRMDAYAPTMMSVGARGMIGKGARLPEVVITIITGISISGISSSLRPRRDEIPNTASARTTRRVVTGLFKENFVRFIYSASSASVFTTTSAPSLSLEDQVVTT